MKLFTSKKQMGVGGWQIFVNELPRNCESSKRINGAASTARFEISPSTIVMKDARLLN